MAKGLTINSSPGKRGITGSQSLSQLSEQIRELREFTPKLVTIESIPIMQEFQELFAMKDQNRQAIGESIGIRGFERNKAVTIGLFPDGSSSLVDGFTRRAGSLDNGLSEIYAWYVEFESVEAAIEWAIHEQLDRRNLSDADIYEYVLRVDQLTGKGKKADGYKGKSSERTAAVVGTSARKVERIRTVEKNATEDEKEKIRTGEESVNSTYQKLKDRKKAPNGANSELTSRNWKVNAGGTTITLWREDQEEMVLLRFDTMDFMFGAPVEQLRKVIEKHMEKILG